MRNCTLSNFFNIAVGCCLLLVSSLAQAEDRFEVSKEGDKVQVKLDGKPLTTYHTTVGAKPILWPIHGPDGVEMTRAYPQVPEGKPGEKKDHIHHRSFWFTHGDVNGVSFWHENNRHGKTVHKKYLKVEGGETAVITTANDWVGPDGKKLCSDVRSHYFSTDGKDKLYIDFFVTVTALYGPVTFGDTKEGSFGVRTAGTMKVDSNPGGKIINSEGKTNQDAWGKPAAWVDYYGPVDGKTVGIAILNHPTSYGFPSHWHVRTYGLFAANPFGLKAFKTGKDGTLKLKEGESFTLKYRVIFHAGDVEQAGIAEEFKRWSK